MKLKDFTKLPTLYRNREEKVNAVTISNVVVNEENGGETVTISAVTNGKHETKIQMNRKTGETKVFCDCESFYFEFSYVLFKHKALLDEEYFINLWKRAKPRKTNRRKNPYNIPAGCKHVIRLARYTISHLHKYLIPRR